MEKQEKSRLRVACEAAALIDFHQLEEIQGNLKSRSSQDVQRMVDSIVEYGFSFPFFVWKQGKHKWCLDGHGRLQALAAMEADGFEIPPVPVSWVQASSKAEAKQKLLRMNSQYGTITMDGLLEFAEDIEIDWDAVALPSGRLDPRKRQDQDPYTRKIVAPIYKPTGARPKLEDLVDSDFADELIAEIAAAQIPEDAKDFLILAAGRHRIFHYDQIAEYYAHAPQEIQALMERSALVIIDFGKAIENGFVRLTKDIRGLYLEDSGAP